jgi:hypothetical protein
MAGDNGTSAEGGETACSTRTYFNGVSGKGRGHAPVHRHMGWPGDLPAHGRGLGVALDTPYQWTKQVASDHGGTKVGHGCALARGIKSKGELRTQFQPCHRRRADHPRSRGPAGAEGGQRYAAGRWTVSACFTASTTPRRRSVVHTQYFEMFGNRAIYHDGWFARTIHKAPWEAQGRRALDDDSAWELYDTSARISA